MTTPRITFPALADLPPEAQVDASPFSNTYLIDGEVLRWSGASCPVTSPVCEALPDGTLQRPVIGALADLDTPEALKALAAAKRAWDNGRGPWPTARVSERLAALQKFSQEMQKEREVVVRLLMWEIAKTRPDAEVEFDRTVLYIRDTIDALKEQDRAAARFITDGGFIGQARRSPFGVVLCMGPFNYPLNETYTTLIPALIMGNTIISKLPRYGGLCQLPLLDAMRRCFPPGVVNVISGDGPTVVGPLMASGDIDVLAFIGTSRVANILSKQHPRPNRLRTVLGLEAKNPAIILPDADLDVAVPECISGALSFNVQRCTAIKIILVHAWIADAFISRFAAALDRLPVGMPWTKGARLTPLPEDNKPQTLQAFVDDALAHGARIINADGGQTTGTYFHPAALYPVTPAMQLWHAEQFGPVIPIATFNDLSEVDDFMQASPYGQQVALFGRDPARIAPLVDALVNQVSRININSQCRRGPDTFPFTGRKDSAEGTLSVTDALRAFSIRALVATTATDPNKALIGEVVSRRMSSFLNTDYIF